jgi:SAM-dependent methyltransferase
MKMQLLDILRAPGTGAPLELRDPVFTNGEVESGTLVAADSVATYAIRNFVPRMVPDDNYAQNFGFQWNRFQRTQLDSHTGLPISRDQLTAFMKSDLAALHGRRVLDVGCGAGRFTEVALNAGAEVVALDYSAAVDACWRNHAFHPRLHVVQGDIYNLPFVPASFECVYCIGVLQHTPDVAAAFRALPPQLAPGGRLTVGLYQKTSLDVLWPKYWLRPVTRRMDPLKLFRVVETVVPLLLPVSRAIARVPRIGRRLRYAVPVANHEPDWPLNEQQIREWAVLNTYDMFSAAYDEPQSAATVRAWFEQAQLDDVEIERVGFLTGRGTRPDTVPR